MASYVLDIPRSTLNGGIHAKQVYIESHIKKTNLVSQSELFDEDEKERNNYIHLRFDKKKLFQDSENAENIYIFKYNFVTTQLDHVLLIELKMFFHEFVTSAKCCKCVYQRHMCFKNK